MTYAFAIAALLEGRVDVAWARWVRPWTLAAWCFLTCGIALGSWWAYYILGWGGFWFWDPVENASLMPWLAGTALLHSAIVVEKRDALKSWTVLLAILAFSLILLGTFLVRSGVLTSVHAFAQDPARGMFILAFLLLVTGGGLALYAWQAPKLTSSGLFQPVSREGALILNNLLLCTLAATVLLGTLYPLFLDLLTGNKVSVGPPFFNATFVPICAPLFAALCVGPFLAWKRAEIAPALARLRIAFAVSVVAAIVTAVAIDGRATLAADRLRLRRLADRGQPHRVRGPRACRAPAACARHAARAHRHDDQPRGAGRRRAGRGGDGVWQVELIKTMKPGDTRAFAGFGVKLDAVAPLQGPNYIAERATITLTDGGAPYTVLTPERRLFTVQKRPGLRDLDPHQPAARPLRHPGRGRCREGLDDPPLLESAGALDLARRRPVRAGRLRVADATGGCGSARRDAAARRYRRRNDELQRRRIASRPSRSSSLPLADGLAPRWPGVLRLVADGWSSDRRRRLVAAVGPRPASIGSVMIGALRAGAAARRGAAEIGQAGAGEFLRQLVHALPRRASAVHAAEGARGRDDHRHRLEGQARGDARLARQARRSVRAMPAFDQDGKLALDWGLSGVPETYLIDGQGIVRLHFRGPLTERDLATILPLLKAGHDPLRAARPLLPRRAKACACLPVSEVRAASDGGFCFPRPAPRPPRPRRRAVGDAEGPRARSPRARDRAGAALRRLPEPGDRRFQRRGGARHAPRRARAPHRRRQRRRGLRLHGGALRRLRAAEAAVQDRARWCCGWAARWSCWSPAARCCWPPASAAPRRRLRR